MRCCSGNFCRCTLPLASCVRIVNAPSENRVLQLCCSGSWRLRERHQHTACLRPPPKTLRMETWESSLRAGGSVGSAARHEASHKGRTAPGCQPAGDAARRSQPPSESQKPALQPMQGTQLLKGFRVGVLTLPLVRRPLI